MTAVADYTDADLIATAEADWAWWLALMVPTIVAHPFAPHHSRFWEWVWSIDTSRPRPFVAVWPRGGAKSTSAEAAVVALGARRRRRYGLVVCRTQDQADKHVASIAVILESDTIARFYPDLGEREVGKYGNSKGWRRNRLRTASGFVVDAIGLDTAARGIKVDAQRPDLIVLDDLDEALDGPTHIARNLSLLTKSLLPAGAANTAIIAIQNLICRDGIFGRLIGVSEHKADFLADRIISGPIPAIEGLETVEEDGRWRIVAGQATWVGQDLDACQQVIDNEGISAFVAECQHDVTEPDGGMWARDFPFRRCDPDEIPDLVRTAVWVDPAVTNKDSSDAMGIQVDGVAADSTLYRLWSWEQRTTPEDALRRAIRAAVRFAADVVGIETDQGGDTWQSVFAAALRAERAAMAAAGDKRRLPVRMRSEKAGEGHGSKVHRAQQMLAAYESRPGIVHVRGTHEILERALRRFPAMKPYDLCDAAWWSWWDLAGRGAPSNVIPIAVDRSEPGWSQRGSVVGDDVGWDQPSLSGTVGPVAQPRSTRGGREPEPAGAVTWNL